MVTKVDIIKADRHCLNQYWEIPVKTGRGQMKEWAAMGRQGLSKLESLGDRWAFIPKSIPFTK